MSDVNANSAIQALREEFESEGAKPFAAVSIGERVNTTRRVVRALADDGTLSQPVFAVVNRLIDDVALFVNGLTDSTTAPTGFDGQYLDKQIANVAFALQGIYDNAVGDSKSVAAENYRKRKQDMQIDLLIDQLGDGRISADEIVGTLRASNANSTETLVNDSPAVRGTGDEVPAVDQAVFDAIQRGDFEEADRLAGEALQNPESLSYKGLQAARDAGVDLGALEPNLADEDDRDDN